MERPINAEHFTLETKASLWIPTNSDIKNFFSVCCNPLGEIEFGYLFHNRYNVTASAGFSYLTGKAIGIASGRASGDKFSLMMIPLRLDFIYRFDFFSEQLIVPFLRAGMDSVIFRETTSGNTISGNKFGLHGGGGVAILLDNLDGTVSLETADTGINDTYFTFEGRYSYISGFSSTGLDLSGIYPYAGLMFQF